MVTSIATAGGKQLVAAEMKPRFLSPWSGRYRFSSRTGDSDSYWVHADGGALQV